jgi:hypothetical protein
MNTQTSQLEKVLDLLQQVDVDGLHVVERTVQQLLQQRTALLPTSKPDPTTPEEFQQRYQVAIDTDLWALVGSQPATPVEEDKTLIHEQIRHRLSA